MTENATMAKSVSGALHQVLKPLGFHKRSNSFNRSVSDGLVHHVSVQLGPYDPSRLHAVPGLLADLYGRYRVNLGVYVPEMNRLSTPRSAWINVYDCQLWWVLGDFADGGGLDQWWDLRDRVSVEEVIRTLSDIALPHLSCLSDAASVLSAWNEQGPDAFGPTTPRAAALDVADLLIARGQREEARALLASYVRSLSPGSDSGHEQHVREYLLERSFTRLAAQIDLA